MFTDPQRDRTPIINCVVFIDVDRKLAIMNNLSQPCFVLNKPVININEMRYIDLMSVFIDLQCDCRSTVDGISL